MRQLINEEIRKKLMYLLVDYSKKGKILDYEFATYFFLMLTQHYNMPDVLSTIDFYAEKDDTDGYYNYKRKSISINRYWYKNFKKNDFNSLMEYNSTMLALYLHEFEHAIQLSSVSKNCSTLEDKLNKLFYELYLGKSSSDAMKYYKNKLSLNMYSKKINRFYNKYHDYFPAERLASFKSFYELDQILNMLEPSISHPLKEKNTKEILEVLKSGYNRDLSKCPLEKIANAYDDCPHCGAFNKMIFKDADNLSSLSKFIYGFPLTKDEYKKLNEKFKAK